MDSPYLGRPKVSDGDDRDDWLTAEHNLAPNQARAQLIVVIFNLATDSLVNGPFGCVNLGRR